MFEIKKYTVVYPFLFALYPVFHLYSKNHEQYGLHVVVLPIVILFAVTAVLLVIFKLLLKDYHRAGALLLMLQIWFFSYTAFRSLITFEIAGIKIYRHQYMMTFWVILLLLLIFLFFRIKFNYRRLTPYFNLICLCMVVFPLVLLAGAHTRTTGNDGAIKTRQKQAVSQSQHINSKLPDIYYIILDAYTGSKALKDYLKFDNSEFTNYLKKKGFFVSADSRSNYSWTSYSIASALNMQYLPTYPDQVNPNHYWFKDYLDTSDMIINNQVLSYLASRGYTYVDLSIWGPPAFKKVDHIAYQRNLYYNLYNTDFYIGLIKTTFLCKPLAENFFEGRVKREKILEKFRFLEKVPDMKGPTFTYAHILIPHHPYVFDQYGNETGLLSKFSQVNERELYLNQLMYANSRIEKIIERILAKPGPPPIIIIQGDHGAFELGRNTDENIQMRMNILNAYYLPNGGNKMLYKSITPVNTFRVIFNYYFGGNFPLLLDQSFYQSSTPNSPLILTSE